MNPQLVPNVEECKKFTYPKKSKKAAASGSDQNQSTVGDEILANFDQCWAESFNKSGPSLISGHLSPFWNSMHSSAFLETMNFDVQATIAFATKSLSSLSQHDQNLLIGKNSRLFLQYLMARYFKADSGLEQLQWILVSNLQQIGKH